MKHTKEIEVKSLFNELVKKILLICFSAILIYSCSSDDENDLSRISYNIKYQDDNYDEHPDKGAKIYIFSGLMVSDVKEYQGSGTVLLQDDRTRSYTTTATTGADGKAVITNIEVNENYIQYIESNNLKGLIYRSAFITEDEVQTYTRDHLFKYDDYINLNP